LTKDRSDEVRNYILENAERLGKGVASAAVERFGITRQAVSKHLRKLLGERALTATGNTRSRSYKLAPLVNWSRVYAIEPNLAEHEVWLNDVRPLLAGLPPNVLDIWEFCFTEMFNNAVDHSAGRSIVCRVRRTVFETWVGIGDDGIGIFRKIQQAMNLAEPRQAILELSKGKLTTDPTRHTGQGIFFTSRLLDAFEIRSSGAHFTHNASADIILDVPGTEGGTAVHMLLDNRSLRTAKAIFDQYSSMDDDYGFTKTVVPVHLAQFGDEKLVSRSQAKMLLARIDRFATAVLDFKGVNSIGHSFADEIFRVFALAHPNISLPTLNTAPEVKKIIDAADARKLADQQERMRSSE
jgi:anti-sigma regulatory factor (Ser/Thr protein kinase)